MQKCTALAGLNGGTSSRKRPRSILRDANTNLPETSAPALVPSHHRYTNQTDYGNPYRSGNIDVLNLLLEHGSFAQNELGMAGLCEYMVSNRYSRFELIKLKRAIQYHCSMGRNPYSADLFRLDKSKANNPGGMDPTTYLATAKYLHGVGCPIDDTSLSTTDAAMRGDLDLLKFLCSIGCPVDENTCRWAAMQANLDCLQYLRSVNCPWDERTIADAHPRTIFNHSNAALRRTTTQLEVREWARANGCPEPPGPLTTAFTFRTASTCVCKGPRYCSCELTKLNWGSFDHAPFLDTF